jgi:2-dehydro-3-deoxyphosphogluconate aldolase / (4S)-4-hydroxy-2-oxoglutarate aldolase
MRIEDTLERIRGAGLVAVVRGVAPECLLPTVTALVEGGVECVDIALSVRGALREISVLKTEFGDRALVGAGEVLNHEMVTLAMSAMADFCSGPTVNEPMIKTAARRDFLAIPGALTPSEIQQAWHMGAPLIKLFPADVFGPEYIRTIHQPFPGIALMPSGGVTAENAGDFLRGGAVAVGAGTALVDVASVAAGDYSAVTASAVRMVEAVKVGRE